MFRDYFARMPYSRDTRENDSLAGLFSFQSCATHMPFSWEPFLRTSDELVMKWNYRPREDDEGWEDFETRNNERDIKK